MKISDKLNEKQRLFVQHYLESFNATQAAIKAGYSEKTAGTTGGENLRKPQIKTEIEKLIKEMHPEGKILKEIGLLAFSNIQDFAEWDDNNLTITPSKDLSLQATSAIKEISFTELRDGSFKKTIKLYDKIKSIELLMKNTGMLLEKVQHSGDLNLTGVIEVPGMMNPDDWDQLPKEIILKDAD